MCGVLDRQPRSDASTPLCASSPGNPLGAPFTLSPSPRNNNYFLSFSIEPTCRRLPYLPASQRSDPPQAYLLAKQMTYLDDTDKFSWTLPALKALEADLGIRVIAGMTNDDEPTAARLEEVGLTNLGKLGKLEFYEQLAKSFVILGVGRPRISPSPWDALCMGVPVSSDARHLDPGGEPS